MLMAHSLLNSEKKLPAQSTMKLHEKLQEEDITILIDNKLIQRTFSASEGVKSL